MKRVAPHELIDSSPNELTRQAERQNSSYPKSTFKMIQTLKKSGRLELAFLCPPLVMFFVYLSGFLPEINYSPILSGYSEFHAETKHKALVSWIWAYFEYFGALYVFIEWTYIRAKDFSQTKWPALPLNILIAMFAWYLLENGTPWEHQLGSRRGRAYLNSAAHVFFAVTVLWGMALFISTKSFSFALMLVKRPFQK